jgi:predicted dinucleotide-binding enzyme
MKKVGILGSGIVAQTLGAGFLRHGYEVKLGTRDPQKLAEWRDGSAPQAQVGTFAEAAAFGDLLVLAVKGTAGVEVLKLAGAENLRGKVIIDTTNPIADLPPINGVIQYFTPANHSLMEDLQAAQPEARFVKAFNSIGSPFMVNPDFGAEKPTMFICGNDDGAKRDVRAILDAFGFEVEDMGKVEGARAIEPLCILWCIPGFLENRWTHAFRLVKR